MLPSSPKQRIMHRLFPLFGLLLILQTTACDGFLDRQPLDQITSENFYQTQADLDRAALAVYSALQDIEWMGKGWMLTEIPSDNSQPGGTDPDFTPIDNFTVNADNPAVFNFWQARYRLVALANSVIGKAPEANLDQTVIEFYVGEVRFLRALAYLDLVRIYGGVPLHQDAAEFGQDFLLPRASVEEVYDLIEADLLAAAAVLPEQRSGAELGRATSGAALATLAKARLTRRDFQGAREAALAVINSGVYRLMEDYGDNWRMPEADNNAESVFQIQYTGCGPWGTGNAMQAFFAPFGEGITKDRDGWGSQIPTAPNLNSPGTTIMNAFEPEDLRKFHTLMTSGNYYPSINPADGGYTYPSQGASAVSANIKKYVIGSGSDVCFMSTSQNGHVIRYSDVLLTLAEAAVGLEGGVSVNPQALTAFNQVRTRAGLPTVEALDREMVFQERRVEFAFEGQRWFDLLRRGDAVETMSFHGKNLQENNLLFPIPSAEMEVNTNLVQNPGY